MHDIGGTQLEWSQETPYGELEAPLGESEELEAAAQLLEVGSEQELEQFLGDLFRRVGQAAGRFARSDVGHALTGLVKDAASKALPMLGGAIGGAIAPGGAAVGQSIAQQAGSLLGLELEGLSPPDQEFELSRQFVRFAGHAYRNALGAPPHMRGYPAARLAALHAARRWAPGLRLGRGGWRSPQFRQPPWGWSGYVAYEPPPVWGPPPEAEPEPAPFPPPAPPTPAAVPTPPQSEYERDESEGPLGEAEEMELAGELMEVADEQELEQFLGDLVRRVGRAVGGVIRSPVGQAVTGLLKTAARQALPQLGGALGTLVAPGVGTALGSQLGTMAGGLFGAELEGMDHAEAEFEAAHRFVQLASAAVQNAATAPPGAPPAEVARQAVESAAQQHAPALAHQMPSGNGHRHAGRWVRHGRRIVLYGI